MSDHPNEGRPAADQGAEDQGTINIPINSVPGELRDAGHPDMNQRHVVKINGQEVIKTTAQLIADAQKVGAAQENFQKAANKEKELEQIRVRDADVQAYLKDGDPDAFRRLGAAYGVPGDRVEEIMSEIGLGQSDEWDEEEVDDGGDLTEAFKEAFPERAPSRAPRPEKVGYDQLSPDIQRALRMTETQRIREIVDRALDNDEVLSYNMKRFSPKDQEVIREELDGKIRGRLPQYGGDFGDGKQILQEVIPEFRRLFEVLAKPERSTGQIGIGPSPGGGNGLAYPTEKPDHVSSNEVAFDQHILETIAYNQANADDAR